MIYIICFSCILIIVFLYFVSKKIDAVTKEKYVKPIDTIEKKLEEKIDNAKIEEMVDILNGLKED